MSKHKSLDYKLSVVKYYLSRSKNQVQTCKIFGCSERSLMRWVNNEKLIYRVLLYYYLFITTPINFFTFL